MLVCVVLLWCVFVVFVVVRVVVCDVLCLWCVVVGLFVKWVCACGVVCVSVVWLRVCV